MKPVMRYHGAKFRLAPWIQQFFPVHHTYVEPFGGAAGVLMQKPRSASEVYNDLDGDIVNVFRVLQDSALAEELVRRLLMTPYARQEFEIAFDESIDPVERARHTLIRASMGFGSAGATKNRTGFRIDSAREYSTASRLWAEYPEQVAVFTERLRGVLIECRPAEEVISGHDRPSTLFFVDPPYLHGTRQMQGHRYYAHEMGDSEHEELLNTLVGVHGFVVLSGYDSDLYNDMLNGWEKHQTKARISAGRGTAIRTECVWLNPQCSEQQAQMDIFGEPV